MRWFVTIAGVCAFGFFLWALDLYARVAGDFALKHGIYSDDFYEWREVDGEMRIVRKGSK